MVVVQIEIIIVFKLFIFLNQNLLKVFLKVDYVVGRLIESKKQVAVFRLISIVVDL